LFVLSLLDSSPQLLIDFAYPNHSYDFRVKPLKAVAKLCISLAF
jgi:hypothetical protein